MATYKRGSGNYKSSFLQIKIAQGDQQVTSSTTLVNASILFMPLKVSRTYAFEFRLFVNSGTTPLLKVAVTAPSGATVLMSIGAWKYAPGSTGTGSVQNMATDGNNQFAVITGRCIMSTTLGNLQLQYAQQVSDAGATKILAGSSLKVYEV